MKQIVYVLIVISLLVSLVGIAGCGGGGEQNPPSGKEEYLQISPIELANKVFDENLTDLQREELWKEYKGKRVRWINELENVESTSESIVATFLTEYTSGFSSSSKVNYMGCYYIVVNFDKAQQSSIEKLFKGDLVTYTGELDTFILYGKGAYHYGFTLKDGTIVSSSSHTNKY